MIKASSVLRVCVCVGSWLQRGFDAFQIAQDGVRCSVEIGKSLYTVLQGCV